MFISRSHCLFSFICVAFVTLAGCETYTVAPLCNESNAARMPGVVGTYQINSPGEKFAVQSQDVVFSESSLGFLKAHSQFKSGSAQFNSQPVLEPDLHLLLG